MKNQYYASGLDPEKVCRLTECLNVYLADLNVLYIKLHNLHWNVCGIGFFDLHLKTQELYEVIAEKSDQVAERIKALGFLPLASMHEYLNVATICELPSEPISAHEVPKIIIEDFCCVLALLHETNVVAKKANDECTVSMLTEAMCFFEKQLWMMNAYLCKC